MNTYPHSSWNAANTRANAHRTAVATLAEHCPVEQGRDYCHVCCAVSTDDPGPIEPAGQMQEKRGSASNAGTHTISALHSPPALNPQADEDEMDDPNIKHLHRLVAAFRKSEAETKRHREQVDVYIQELKRQGYSYPVLARESGLSQGTIQNIVAKDTI
jgi:hypothetical protein